MSRRRAGARRQPRAFRLQPGGLPSQRTGRRVRRYRLGGPTALYCLGVYLGVGNGRDHRLLGRFGRRNVHVHRPFVGAGWRCGQCERHLYISRQRRLTDRAVLGDTREDRPNLWREPPPENLAGHGPGGRFTRPLRDLDATAVFDRGCSDGRDRYEPDDRYAGRCPDGLHVRNVGKRRPPGRTRKHDLRGALQPCHADHALGSERRRRVVALTRRTSELRESTGRRGSRRRAVRVAHVCSVSSSTIQ